MANVPFRISEATKSIVFPYHPKLERLFAGSVVKEGKEGNKYLIIPHHAHSTRIFNNLNIDIPPPVLCHYDWNGTVPFDAQRHTTALLTMNSRAYVLNEIGTGKTRAALYAVDYLQQQGLVDKVCVVAPLSTLSAVWDGEIFRCFPHMTCAIAHGTRPQREAAFKENVDIYIINTDGLRIRAIQDILTSRTDINCLIIDEVALFRNSQTERWKALSKIVCTKDYVWGMTGAPTPNAPTDAYGQIKLLTPNNLPAKYFKQFQDLTMTQITQYRWIPKPNANDIIHDAMQPAVRYSRADCIDLPPVLTTERSVAMTPDQTKAYKQMVDHFIVQLANKERVTAVNAGVQMSKLLQICAGFLYSEHTTIDLDYAPRVDALCEILEETEKKVIVYLPFKHGVDRLLGTLLGRGIDAQKVYGDTPKAQRDKIFQTFQHTQEIRVLVAHPQCMSHGLTLTAANTVVWFSPTTSGETYEQANGRVSRPGQDSTQLVVHITSGQVERRVFKVLEGRGNLQAELLDMFNNIK